MIWLRIVTGIRQHFGIRFPEWLMLLPLLGWGLSMTLDPRTFSTSPSFSVIARYGDESTWGSICFFAATARLVALTVNGTFNGFRFSPHMRAVASVIGAFVWGQVVVGIAVAAIYGGGAWTGVFAYSTFAIAELWNIFRARADAKAQREPHAKPDA